jgi:hypothetical protein
MVSMIKVKVNMAWSHGNFSAAVPCQCLPLADAAKLWKNRGMVRMPIM